LREKFTEKEIPETDTGVDWGTKNRLVVGYAWLHNIS
jgi:hypothetical protein